MANQQKECRKLFGGFNNLKEIIIEDENNIIIDKKKFFNLPSENKYLRLDFSSL